MKYSQIISAAVTVVTNLAANPPERFSDLAASINRELDGLGIAFEERRYVCAAIAQEARSRALGLAPPASKILKKVAGYATDAHDEWADTGFFRRGSARRATQEELDMRRIRESTISDFVEGAIQVVSAMRDVVRVDVHNSPTIHAHVMVPHEAVRKRVGAKSNEESEPPASKPANNNDDASAPSPPPPPAAS